MIRDLLDALLMKSIHVSNILQPRLQLSLQFPKRKAYMSFR